MNLNQAILAMKAEPFRQIHSPQWKRLQGIFWDSQRQCFMNQMIDGKIKPCVILAKMENVDFQWRVEAGEGEK